MATVVPMLRAASSSFGTPLDSIAFITASTGRRGVDGVLATTSWFVASSMPIKSVKVPPVSMPIRTDMYVGPLPNPSPDCGRGAHARRCSKYPSGCLLRRANLLSFGKLGPCGREEPGTSD